jgi:hypothetical protein
MMIVNCTPHAIDVYAPDVPGIVDPQRHTPVFSFEPSGIVARLSEVVLDDLRLAPRVGAEAVKITRVEYGHAMDLPPVRPKTWYVVGLPLALALPGRRDLLVSYRQVRNAAGTIVGCRGLARPE